MRIETWYTTVVRIETMMKFTTIDERVATGREIARLTDGKFWTSQDNGKVRVYFDQQYVEVCEDGIDITQTKTQSQCRSDVKGLCRENDLPVYEVTKDRKFRISKYFHKFD